MDEKTTETPKKKYKWQEEREAFTKAVVEQLQQGKVFFWDQGVRDTGIDRSAVTGKPYRGGNAMRLYIYGLMMKDEFKGETRWATFKQASDRGWKLKKGSKGIHLEYWKQVSLEDIKKRNPSLTEEEAREKWRDTPPVCNCFTVFNCSQMENVPPLPPREESDAEYPELQAVLDNCEAKVLHDQTSRNFYSPVSDEIHLMSKENFKSDGFYYGTAVHEVAHSTGAKGRLDRQIENRFGTPEYAKEEAVAEFTSMFLCKHFGAQMGEEHIKNHMAYIDGWAEEFKKDPNLLFQLAGEASRAEDYIVSNYMKGLDLERREAEYEKKIAELAKIPEEKKQEQKAEAVKTAGKEKERPVKRTSHRTAEETKGRTRSLNFLQD